MTVPLSPLLRRRRAGHSHSDSDRDSGAAGPEPLRGAREHQAPAAGVRRGRRRGAVAGAEHAGAERGGAGTGERRAGERGRRRGASPHPPPGVLARPEDALGAEPCSAGRAARLSAAALGTPVLSKGARIG